MSKYGAHLRSAYVFVRTAYIFARELGIDPRKTISNSRFIWRLFTDYRKFKRAWQLENEQKRMPLAFSFPVLQDYAGSAGVYSGHYFHMDLWTAKRIYAAKPERHVDVGSRIDGFISHLLVFCNVDVIDIRPIMSQIPGLSFIQADAMEMSHFPDGSVHSLSCLHAAEHFGLGRYGDPIDPQACWKFIASLGRVLARGGRLYFAVPVGRERIEFNGHRVFNPMTLVRFFESHELTIVTGVAVDDEGNLVEQPDWEKLARSEYACGIYELTKR